MIAGINKPYTNFPSRNSGRRRENTVPNQIQASVIRTISGSQRFICCSPAPP